MRFAVISVTKKGSELSRKITAALNEKYHADNYCFEKYKIENSFVFSDLQTLLNDIFYIYDGLIFVCAVGIAVRKTASLLRSKLTDPAVIVVDELGKFAVSILSGHIGGANALAQIVADKLGAVPVITTATDAGGKFSPDSFAAANDLYICDMKAAKEFSSAVLNGEKIGISSDFPIKNIPDDFFIGSNSEYGICISEDRKKKPFKRTLNLVPKKISIGFGCKKNICCEKFEEFMLKTLEKNNIKITEICYAATIELKKNERAALQFCRKYSIPLKFYTAEQLMNVDGSFSASDFVKSTTGADNVCERSAVTRGGKIIVPKYSENGITFAAAVNEVNIDFERRIF